MVDLAIITPTRGRPRQFAELVEAVNQTAAGDVQIWAGLDYDDESDYLAALVDVPGAGRIVSYRGERRSLSAWTNFLAAQAVESSEPPRYLASLGDDHRPRSGCWDRDLIGAIEQLGGSGIAYGNDLLQGEKLPTAWVVSADIVRTLGWMMLPVCDHMYVDDATLALGQASGRIVYCPDVVIEHLHPEAGKADWDESYLASNADERFAKDGEAFTRWQREGGLAADVAKLRGVPLMAGG
jgi:GT2 family glycosyltransferase